MRNRIGIGIGLALIVAATVRASDDSALLKGRRAAGDVSEAIRERMADGLQEKGLAGTLSVCYYQTKAAIAETEKKLGVRLKRTSLAIRNPENAPDAYEAEILRQYAALAKSGERLPDEGIDRRPGEDGKTVYRYVRPIVMKEMCIGCHGPVDRLDPDVRSRLQEKFPRDAAVGYRPGDFCGIMSVTIPSD